MFSRRICSEYLSFSVWISNINAYGSLCFFSIFLRLINRTSTWTWLYCITWWRSFLLLRLIIIKRLLWFSNLFNLSRFSWLRFLRNSFWTRLLLFLSRLLRNFLWRWLSFWFDWLLLWNWSFLLDCLNRFLRLGFWLFFDNLLLNRLWLYFNRSLNHWLLILKLSLWVVFIRLRFGLDFNVRFNLLCWLIKFLNVFFNRLFFKLLRVIIIRILNFHLSFNFIFVLCWWNSINEMMFGILFLFIKLFYLIEYFIIFTSWNLLNPKILFLLKIIVITFIFSWSCLFGVWFWFLLQWCLVWRFLRWFVWGRFLLLRFLWWLRWFSKLIYAFYHFITRWRLLSFLSEIFNIF